VSGEVLKRLDDPGLVGVRCQGDLWPSGRLSQTRLPEGWLGLVVKPDGRRRLVPAGEDPHPSREDTLVLVRSRPISFRLALADVSAADGHPVSGSAELLLRCAARDDDLAAASRTLLTSDELTLDRLAEAVTQAGARAAFLRFIREHSAEQLVQQDQRAALLECLRAGLESFLFSAGLILEGIGKLEFASQSLSQDEALRRATARRVEEIEARGVVEQAALSATQRRLDSLTDVVAKLKRAAEADAGLQWHDLLPALTPSERGRLLESLWRLTPDRVTATAIVVAAGRECVWLDPAEPERIIRRVTLPEELGGLRSVSFDPAAGALLVGAAVGVWRVKAADGEVLAKHVAPHAEMPRTGFNAAITSGTRLIATHSQLGAWSWPVLGSAGVPPAGSAGVPPAGSTGVPPAGSTGVPPAEPQPLLQPSGGVPKTIRAVTAAGDGHVLFAADDEIHVFSPTGQPHHTLPIGRGLVHGIAVLDRAIYVTTSDGLVLEDQWDAPNIWQVLHRRSGPIESIQARRWDDLVELVIPAGPQGVLGIYAQEGIVSRLLDTSVPVRRAWACDDALVALSEHRDRLIVLRGTMPARTGQEVIVARLLGQLIQDACIVTSHQV
jgi:hypothetical protein